MGLSGILHVHEVGVVLALLVVGEGRVVADAIVANLQQDWFGDWQNYYVYWARY